MPTFRELAAAAHCPHALYQRQRLSETNAAALQVVDSIRELAFRYPSILDGGGLADTPIEVTPAQYRVNLGASKAGLRAFPAISDPPARDRLIEGEHSRGWIHKRLPGPSLSLVFAGNPPDEGIWHHQCVRLVAAARALSTTESAAVDQVYAEYPAIGVVRAIEIDSCRRGAYHDALCTVRSLNGPAARDGDLGQT